MWFDIIGIYNFWLIDSEIICQAARITCMPILGLATALGTYVFLQKVRPGNSLRLDMNEEEFRHYYDRRSRIIGALSVVIGIVISTLPQNLYN